jgi:hypothetical protein|tara:strand:- start:658 stop:882 length:225 start_codon:yes stop_codon:yes gene_type:complete
MNMYEIGIYNKYVRNAIRQGDDPPAGLDKKWEEVYLFEYIAESTEAAQKKAEAEFPPSLGYVVDGVLRQGMGNI